MPAYTLEITQKETLEAAGNIDVQTFGTYDFEYVGYNLLDDICKDKTVRHAIDYCIDRDTVIEMSYAGLAEVAYGAVTQKDYRYDPADKRDFNIKKGKRDS